MIYKIKREVAKRKLVFKKTSPINNINEIILEEWLSAQRFDEFYKPYILKMLSRRGYLDLAQNIVNSNVTNVLDHNMLIYHFPVIPLFQPNYTKERTPSMHIPVKTREIRCSYAIIEGPHPMTRKKYKIISEIDGYNIFEKTIKEWETFFIDYICNQYFELEEKQFKNE